MQLALLRTLRLIFSLVAQQQFLRRQLLSNSAATVMYVFIYFPLLQLVEYLASEHQFLPHLAYTSSTNRSDYNTKSKPFLQFETWIFQIQYSIDSKEMK